MPCLGMDMTHLTGHRAAIPAALPRCALQRQLATLLTNKPSNCGYQGEKGPTAREVAASSMPLLCPRQSTHCTCSAR